MEYARLGAVHVGFALVIAGGTIARARQPCLRRAEIPSASTVGDSILASTAGDDGCVAHVPSTTRPGGGLRLGAATDRR